LHERRPAANAAAVTIMVRIRVRASFRVRVKFRVVVVASMGCHPGSYCQRCYVSRRVDNSTLC